MKRVSFRVLDSPDMMHPIHRGIIDSTTVSSAKLLQWGPKENITTFSWFDGDHESVKSILGDIDSVRTFQLSGGSTGTYAIINQTNYELGSSLLNLITHAGVVFVPPVTFDDTGEISFEAVGETETLSGLYRQLNDKFDVMIEIVKEYNRRPSPVSITERQLASLETALSIGYYEVPRMGSIKDIAAELDCATSTAGELLRNAEAAVIASYVDETSPE